MKTYLLVLLCLFSTEMLYTQYVVIKTNESVYADDKLLEKKDKVHTSAQLRFSSPEAFAIVVLPGKGYFILGIKDRSNTQGEFILALKDALLPPNEYYAASTRTYEPYEANKFEDEYDIKAFFRNQLFFVAPTTFEVSSENFPLDSTHFFMIQHQLSDGWIRKSLPSVNQSFEISPNVLRLQGNIFEEHSIQQSELYYRNDETGEEQFLGRFRVTFPSPKEIKTELKTLRKLVDKTSTNQFMIEHAMPYLNLVYGKTQPETVAQLVTPTE